MEVTYVMQRLEQLGTEQTKKIWQKHGATGEFFGVNIGKMKQLIRELKLKNNTALAKELFLTENVDAMYLAGLIVNPKELDFDTLKLWAELATWSGITESIVPWCAAEAGLGLELGQYCLSFPDDIHQSMAYAILGSYIIVTADNLIDIDYISTLLVEVSRNIHSAGNRTKYTMNNFVICVAASCAPFYEQAIVCAEQIGTVNVNMEGTSCHVPDAITAINKTVDRYGIGHKRKKVRC